MATQVRLEAVPKQWIGASVKRIEDGRLLLGETSFVDDIPVPDVLHVAIFRSAHAHARLKSVDVSKALTIPGVVAAITGEQIRKMSKTLPSYAVSHLKPEEYCMAVEKVRYVGEPIAAVAAISSDLAEDALEAIEVEYEVLPATVDPEKAMRNDAPLVFDSFGTNVVAHYHQKWGEVEKSFKDADVIVRDRVRLHRYSSTPLETIGVIANYVAGKGELTLWCNAQMVGHVMMVVSDVLGIPTNKLRVIVQDIGGGFGIKTRPFKPLLIASLLSIKSGKPVRYTESRQEHLMAAGQSAGAIFDIEVAAKKDGEILALRIHDVNDDGASITYAGTHASMHGMLLSGCYRIRNAEWDSYTVLTNTCPSMPNRGVGKPGIVYAVERMMDFLGESLNLDPVQVRLRNYIQPDEFPYLTVSGRTYDSGNYPALLKKAMEAVGYERILKEQLELRKKGRYLGIGICTYVHAASATISEIEGVSVRMDPAGKVLVRSGSPDMGTSHATTFAQILAQELGVRPEDVNVLGFDSFQSPWTQYSGTHANKFSGPDVESFVTAVRTLRTKMITLASKMLHCDSKDVILENGRAYASGMPNQAISLAEVASKSYQNPALMPHGLQPGLECTYVGNSPKALDSMSSSATRGQDAGLMLLTGSGSVSGYLTYPSSAHIAVVEVDIETGQIKIVRYVVVHDVGKIINPMIAEGLVHGSALHGIAAALMEGFLYGDDGQPLATTFMDYLKPTSLEAPVMTIDHIESPSPRSILGIKGLGEGEALGPLAAIPNAVDNALESFGVRVRDLPISPEMILNLVRKSKQRS